MNHRKLKKATKYLCRRFDAIGAQVTMERCAELLCEFDYLSFEAPVSPHKAACIVAREEEDDLCPK